MAKSELATFAGGCFWCLEAVFERVKGVDQVQSGYTGGSRPNPSYEQVCTGTTGHAEAIQIRYDPNQITFQELLEIFFAIHDPTTPDRQGADIGSQYRSVIFYHSDKQKEQAKVYIQHLEAEKVFTNPIVTEIDSFRVFYPAEIDHYRYFDRNPNAPYCQVVIDPKVQKLLKNFKDKAKPWWV